MEGEVKVSKHKIWLINPAYNEILKKSSLIFKNNQKNKLVKEKIDIRESIGRILAEECRSELNIPSKPTSMMDGFAVYVEADSIIKSEKEQETNENNKNNELKKFKILKKVYADGQSKYISHDNNDTNLIKSTSIKDSCVYVTTGSPIPEEFNCVIPVEKLLQTKTEITLLEDADLKEGLFIRSIGENIQIGEVLLDKGSKISEVDVALLVSVGITSVVVFSKLKIGIMSNGDEVCDPFNNVNNNNKLTDGMIYDSNKTILTLLIKKHFEESVEIVDLGINKDTLEAVSGNINKAYSLNCSLIISTGGVSMGEHDYVKMFFETDEIEDNDNNDDLNSHESNSKLSSNYLNFNVNKIHVGRINMKPGLPTMMANYKNSVFFGLSGNPVSCVVGYYMFVKDTIKLALSFLNENEASNINNTNYFYNNMLEAELLQDLEVNSDREELKRGQLFLNNNKFYCMSTMENQLSSTFKSLKNTNCFILLPNADEYYYTYNTTIIKKGCTVKVYLLESIVMISNEELNKIKKSSENKKINKKMKSCCCSKANNINNNSSISSRVKVEKNSNQIENKHINSDDNSKKIRVGLLVISDKLLNNEYDSNLALNLLSNHFISNKEISENFTLINNLQNENSSITKNDNNSDNLENALFNIIPNDKELIKQAIIDISNKSVVNIIITSGGTGVSKKDKTSQAVKEIIEKECFGLSNLIMTESLKITPFACLSSPVVGILKNTLIVTAPGKPKAIIEVFDIIKDVLPHIVNQLTAIEDFH